MKNEVNSHLTNDNINRDNVPPSIDEEMSEIFPNWDEMTQDEKDEARDNEMYRRENEID